MFGMTFGKLLVLAALICVVWYGCKYAARVEAIQRSLREEALRRRGRERHPPAKPIEDLMKCPRCGAYVAASGAADCGRPGCPWTK